MPTLIINDRSKRRSKIDLHDKRIVNAVAVAVARTRGADVQPKDCRNDARTIVSAWVLGQDEATAAQRLLTWWCIDCGMKVLYLDKASPETVVKVSSSAKAGYAALEAIEKYGTTWLEAEPGHKPASPTVSSV
jgi:hypothetical protein